MIPKSRSDERQPRRPGRHHRSARRVSAAVLAITGAAALAIPAPSSGQALPGDVYFSADVFQRFKYYVFASNYVQWEDETIEGTSLVYSAVHDTTTQHGSIHISTDVLAEAGRLEFNLNSEMSLSAQFGVFHETYNNLTARLYIRGPSGTPYDMTITTSGILEASREGGLPGTLRPVNGTSIAQFEEDRLWIQNGGTFSLPLDDFEVVSGTTGPEILIDGETYSRVIQRVFTSYGSISQALCVLGCMQAPATFHSLVDAHVAINVYPGGVAGMGDAAEGPEPAATPRLTLAAAPNPARGTTTVSFAAPAGDGAVVDVLDVSGRKIARLFAAPATGHTQTVSWDAAGIPAGIYFLRAEQGSAATTTKLTLVK